jgi:hypothetical protein
MSNEIYPVSFNSELKANSANKLFPNSEVCQMLHKMESVEGGKYGFVKMIMLDNETALKLLNINTDNRPLSKERSKSYKEMILN